MPSGGHLDVVQFTARQVTPMNEFDSECSFLHNGIPSQLCSKKCLFGNERVVRCVSATSVL